MQKPPWIRVKIPSGEKFGTIRTLVKEKKLHTVCEEALCPNLGECWGRGTATFLILGGICTRDCRFCGVHNGRPDVVREEEAAEVADAVFQMRLRHAVITSVTRDDLPDGGAWVFAATIDAIRGKLPECRIEVLVPDFLGDETSIEKVVRAAPHIFGHNIETVPRLYTRVRPQADYVRSLAVLAAARAKGSGVLVKSGMMVGLGESRDEIVEVMADLRSAGCDILTIGQYLCPTRAHFPVTRFYHPNEFDSLKEEALSLGFRYVEAGPLVRSSYHADSQATGAGITPA